MTIEAQITMVCALETITGIALVLKMFTNAFADLERRDSLALPSSEALATSTHRHAQDGPSLYRLIGYGRIAAADLVPKSVTIYESQSGDRNAACSAYLPSCSIDGS